MTEISPNVWEATIDVPTQFTKTVNWVFNDGTDWDSNSKQSSSNSGNTNSRDWHAFIGP